MSLNAVQSVAPVPLSDRLLRRAESLGVSLASVVRDASGMRVDVIGRSRWLDAMLVESPLFAAAIRHAMRSLLEKTGEPVKLWTGLWVTCVSIGRARRGSEESAPLLIAIFPGRPLIDSEQFRQICDANKLDHQATVSRIDRSTLFTDDDVRRWSGAFVWMHEDTQELDRRDVELHGLSTELGESYEELSLLYKLAGNMAVDQPPANFLTEACRELQQVVGLRWLALTLIEGDPRMDELGGQVFTAGDDVADDDMLQRIGNRLMRRPMDPAEPTIIQNLRELEIPGLQRIARDLMVVPLSDDNQLLGVLFGGDKLDGSGITSVDTKLCSALANTMSIFIQNVMLYEDVQAMFMGTLHGLTAAIDAKDSYTFGHSERVALMSRLLAVAAGLDSRTVERVYLAGLIHDVGKIGVPESVLCKPGRLTAEEFELIKLHPEIGGRILADIRQMEDLVPGVLYHHERWDGGGYPSGKAGEDIPLFGRLICLADSFDAMSSSRTYRQRLPHDEVMEEIIRCAGSQFDPQLAQTFITLDFQPFFDMIELHQQQVRKSA